MIIRSASRIAQIVASLAVFSVTATAAAADAQVRASEITLRTEAGAVRADLFEPAATAARGTVVVLHGAGGMLLDGAEMRRLSRHLAAEGNAVYLLHYFNSTGTPFAFRAATMQRHFPAWRRTVLDALAEIQSLRGDRARIGIYGYSLGGFLALYDASDNPRVGGVVEHAAGVWQDKLDRLGKLPPVLLIHGERDTRVTFHEHAAAAVPELRKRSPHVRTRFFTEEGHGFSRTAMKSVREETATFFARWLRRP